MTKAISMAIELDQDNGHKHVCKVW